MHISQDIRGIIKRTRQDRHERMVTSDKLRPDFLEGATIGSEVRSYVIDAKVGDPIVELALLPNDFRSEVPPALVRCSPTERHGSYC